MSESSPADSADVAVSVVAMDASLTEKPAQIPARRRTIKMLLLGLAAVAAVCGVAVGIMMVTSAVSGGLQVPETFAANFQLTPKKGGLGATGAFHKTVNDKGEWVLTGWVIVEGATQTTTVVAARDGAVYYSVVAGNKTVEQSCMDQARSTPHFQALQEALESVRSVAGSRAGSGLTVPSQCDADRAWTFEFQGLPLMICQTRTGAFMLVGEGVSGSVYNIDTEVPAVSPIEPVFNMTSGELMECPPILAVRSSSARELALAWSAGTRTVTQSTSSYISSTGIKVITHTTTTTQCWTLTGSRIELLQIDVALRKACVSGDAFTYENCEKKTTAGVVTWRCMTCPNIDRYGNCITFHDSANPAQASTTFTPPPVPKPRLLAGTSSEYLASALPQFKRCVFVHGPGVLPAAGAASVQSTFPEYWGDANSHANCEKYLFLQLDTTTQSWDSLALSQQFCNAASGEDRVIKNTVVFAHGSGNLIIATAVATGVCSFDKQTSAWVELQASSNSARMSEVAADICSYRDSWDHRQEALQVQSNFCLGDSSTLAPGWSSVLNTFVPTGVTWTQVADIIKAHVSGAMCGDYSAGLLDSTQWAIAPYVEAHHGSPADDVAWSTCWDVEYHERFSVTDFGSTFYAPSVNYWDVTCRNGDGMYGSHRHPCGWMGAIAHE